MKFNYIVKENLPQMSWCAVIIKDKDEVQVTMGKSVEKNSHFFVEGAWNGDFLETEFDKKDFFCGTGGKIYNDDSIIFATSSHTHEMLVSIRCEDRLYISNSISFLLSMTKNSLDNNYPFYEKDFVSIVDGISNYKRMIKLKNDKILYCYYYCNIYVGKDLTISEIKKEKVLSFVDYNDYYDSILHTLESLRDNANDSRRTRKYGLITTISSGYDASAVSALAKKIGCSRAVSFNKPKKYEGDCGYEVAKELGYKDIVLKSAEEYLKNEELVEAEYVSSGDLGTEIIFSAFEKEFEGNIVFFGERGDVLWDINSEDINDEFRCKNEIFATISHTENRLRVGYIYVALPTFRAATWTSIYKITTSDEMKPYSIGGNYDRPIPRRILEESGVNRSTFGQEKKGAGFNYRFDNLLRIKKRMSQKSYDSFLQYYKNNRRTGLKELLLITRYFIKTFPLYMEYLLSKLGINKKLHIKAIRETNPGVPSYLIFWGMDEMINRYTLGLGVE